MDQNKIKIIFFGTPEFAAGILKTLIENKFNVAAVFAQPDKKIGRQQKVMYSPVKELVTENGIKVFQPASLRDENIIEEIKNINPDLIVVAAYGKILPKVVLDIPKLGAINVHASLLPKYRGAAPVQCAILAGEKETGITLIEMNEKMDEGDILVQEKIDIGEKETADILLEKLARSGAKMIVEFIPDWVKGKIKPVSQDHGKAIYCKPIQRKDGKIDWNLDAAEIYRKWRAYHPWPGIYTLYKGKRLKLMEIESVSGVETGEIAGKIVKYNQDIVVQAKKGGIILKKIQLEGKKEMRIEEFLRGCDEFIGSELN